MSTIKYLDDNGLARVKTNLDTKFATKQDVLTAGNNITIQNNVISATSGTDIPQQDTAPSNPSEDDLWIDTSKDGMIPIDSEVSTTSTNAVQNQAITNYINGVTVGVELYNDTTGSNTTVTLNQSASNFSCLEIFYRSNDSIYGSTKVYSPNGKAFNVTMVRSTGSTTASNTYLKTADFNISGTSITIGNYGEILYQTNGNFSINANSNIYITRVVGIE